MMRVHVVHQLTFDAETYSEAGNIMDAVEAAVLGALHGQKARWDFTSFNTTPCKEIEMDRLRYQEPTPYPRDEMATLPTVGE